MQYGIAFTPLVPTLVLWLGLGAIVVVAALLLLGRARGAAVRVAALALILLALANPSFTREDREPLSSVAAVVIDKSPSQNFGDRTKTAQAQQALVDRLKQVKGLEVRVVEAGQADGETDGTKLFGALSSALSDVPTDRVAGAFLITDGRVHDIPANAAGARISGAGACADHRTEGRARSSHRHLGGAALRHRRPGPDHHLPARRPGRQRRARPGRGAPRRRRHQRAHRAERPDRQSSTSTSSMPAPTSSKSKPRRSTTN